MKDDRERRVWDETDEEGPAVLRMGWSAYGMRRLFWVGEACILVAVVCVFLSSHGGEAGWLLGVALAVGFYLAFMLADQSRPATLRIGSAYVELVGLLRTKQTFSSPHLELVHGRLRRGRYTLYLCEAGKKRVVLSDFGNNDIEHIERFCADHKVAWVPLKTVERSSRFQ